MLLGGTLIMEILIKTGAHLVITAGPGPGWSDLPW